MFIQKARLLLCFKNKNFLTLSKRSVSSEKWITAGKGLHDVILWYRLRWQLYATNEIKTALGL